jgi:iron(III) transport system ATP-binding protein
MPQDMILTLHHLSKRYARGRQYAVEDVSLELRQGDILALVGESGSGKTTLLRLIAGLEHPDRGRIVLRGAVVAEGARSVPPNQRKAGMVFQDYALFPHLTVLENVKFGLAKAQAEAERIAQMSLQAAGLTDHYERYPHQLSGGQQQRVALARAIAPNPTILLLDEPFSNLDATLKDQVREEIRFLIKKTGITAVFVTHDTQDALASADQVAILQQGKLQQIGPPQALYEQPANAYVANFFGPLNEIRAQPSAAGFQTGFGLIVDERASLHHAPLTLRFRPEHARLVPQGGLEGRVEQVAYHGSHQMLRLSNKQGETIRLQCPPQTAAAAGSLVGFSLEHFEVLPE